MQLVIADTSPINYLLLIGHIEVLPALFDRIILPSTVRDELAALRAPAVVRNWTAALPAWIDIRTAQSHPADPANDKLDSGEREAIVLAGELNAGLLLMEDRDGVAVAREKGFRVAGTLTVLAMAAGQGLLDLIRAIELLKRTNFHYRQEIIDRFIAQYKW